MKKQLKKALSLFLAVTLTLSLLPAMTLPSLAATGPVTAAYNQYLVNLTADAPNTAPIGGASGFGTAASAGRVWTDKAVSVTQGKAAFDVTLSALAQEYMTTSQTNPGLGSGGNQAALAADVTFILDMSSSMNSQDVVKDGGGNFHRVEAMVKAANEAIDIVMKANPKNRVAVHWFGAAVNNAHVGTFMEMGSYSKDNAGYYLRWGGSDEGTSAGLHYVWTDASLKKDGANYLGAHIASSSWGTKPTTLANARTTDAGTPTQDGIMYGLSKAINDIKNTSFSDTQKGGKRQPYVFILSDGAAISAHTDFSTLPGTSTNPVNDLTNAIKPATYTKTAGSGTTTSNGSANTGSAQIAALTILTASYMKNQLETAYHTYNTDNTVKSKFYTVGLGSDTAINGPYKTNQGVYAWAGLDPAFVYENRGNSAVRLATAVNTHNQINTYSSTYAADGKYIYSDYYKFANTYPILGEAFTELSSDVEAATTILPLFDMPSGSGTQINGSAAEMASAIAITDNITTGLCVDLATLKIGNAVAEFDSTVTGGKVYKFPGLESKVVIKGQELTWYINADDMQAHIYRFANRTTPAAGVYTAPTHGAFALEYSVVPSFTETPDVIQTKTYNQSTGAQAYFTPPNDSPYYTGDSHVAEKVLGKNGTLTLDMGILKTGLPTTANVGSTITYTATVYNYTDTAKTNVAVASESTSKTITNIPAGGSSSQDFTFTAPGTVPAGNKITSGTANITVGSVTVSSNTVDTTITAKPTYTVTFNTNGGSAVTPLTGVVQGDRIAAPTPPTLAGYAFTGWYKEAGLTNLWNFASDTVTAATNLYAGWTDEFAATVNLTLDGGAYSTPTVTLYQSGVLKHTLTGSSGSYSDSDVKNGTYNIYVGGVDTGKTITVYGAAASATLAYYTASFDLNGGTSSSIPNQIVLSGETPTTPTPPTWAEHSFRGWSPDIGPVTARTIYTATWDDAPTHGTATVTVYKDGEGWTTGAPVITIVDGSGTAVANGTDLTFGTYKIYADGVDTGREFIVDGVQSNEDLTYYTVSFDKKGGTGSAPDQIILSGGKAAAPTTPPTKASYRFLGWYKDESLTTLWNFSSDTVTARTTLYAGWENNINTISGTATVYYDYTDPGDGTKKFVHSWDRPTGATIVLKRNGQQVATQSVSFTTDGVEYSAVPFTFADQPIKDASGVPYTYTVTTSVYNYTTSPDTGNHNIDLTFNPQTLDIPFQVLFDGVSDAVKPTQVRLHILYGDHPFTTLGGVISQHPSDSVYCAAVPDDYDGDYPVWVYDWQGNLYDYQVEVIGYMMGTELVTAAASGFDFTYGDWVYYDDAQPGDASGTMTVTLTPKTYAVTYRLNGGNGTGSDTYTYGNGLTLPTPTRGGFNFAGWYSEPDFPLDAAVSAIAATDQGDMTLYAKWTPENTYSIDGTVKNDATTPVAVVGATVKLVRGNEVIGSTTTNSEGKFSFDSLPNGVYNLVITGSDGTVVTTIVEITGNNCQIGTITIPAGLKNTIVIVNADTPAVVVGGLPAQIDEGNVVVDDEKGVTLANLTAVDDGGKLTLELQATGLTEETAPKADEIKAAASGQTVGLYIDLSVYKYLWNDATQADLEADETTQLSELRQIVTVYLPLDASLQGRAPYSLYRYHDGAVQSIPLGAARAEGGEYFELSADATMLILHIRKFSTYAVAYTNPRPSGGNGPVSATIKFDPNKGLGDKSAENMAIGGKYALPANPFVREGYQFAGWKISTTGEVLAPGTTISLSGSITLVAQWTRAEGDSDVSGLLNTDEHFYYVIGRGNDCFWPDACLTRAETAQMFYRLLRDKNVAIGSDFPDVAEDAWYATAIGAMSTLGIVTGYPDGNFRPDEPITRAQFAAIAVRFAKLSPGEIQFSDVPGDHWAYGLISTAAKYDWIVGDPGGTFRPEANISRAEAVTLVNRVLGRVADQAYVDSDAQLVRYTDVRDHWGYYDIMEASNTHDFQRDDSGETWTPVE